MKTTEIQQGQTYPRHPEIRKYSPGSGAGFQFPPFISGGLSKYGLNLENEFLIRRPECLKQKTL